MAKRFWIGTVTGATFNADTIGNDPELTTFDTLEAAISDIQGCIAHAAGADNPINNGAIWDLEAHQIVWRQA